MKDNDRHYRNIAILAAFFGATLAAMDFELFLGALPGITALFHISSASITTMTDFMFIGSAIGAFGFGSLADKYGRKFIFMVMTIIYAVGSFFTAFATTIATFAATRAFGGLGTGGDEPLGFTIVAEETTPEQRTFGLMIVSFTFPAGAAIGAAIVYLFVTANLYLPYVFFIGIIPALLVLFLRKRMRETPRFQDIKKAREELQKKKAEEVHTEYKADLKQAVKNTFAQMYAKGFARTSLLIAIFVTYAAGIVAFDLIYFPYYLIATKGFSFAGTLEYEFIGYALSILGFLYAAPLGKKIGRKNVLFINLTISALILIGMVFATAFYTVVTLYILFQVFLWSLWAAWPLYINEAYPTRMRATASTYGYGFQWVGNIVVPTIIGSALALGVSWNSILEFVIVLPLFILIAIAFPWKISSPTAELEQNAI